MKKMISLLLILFLYACDNNTISIQHTDSGYTKHLAYTIDLNNKYIITNASLNDGVIHVDVQTNDYEYVKSYYIDSSTFEEIEDYDPTPFYYNETFEIPTLETKTYSIISEYTQTKNDYIINVYYKDNNQNIKLFEFNESATLKSGYPVHGYFDQTLNKGYLYVCNEDYFSIYEINNGELNEINTIPYIDGDYTFKEIIEGTNIFIFENDNQIKWIQDEEIFYIEKNIDAYELMSLDYVDGKVLVYNKNDEIRLVIDNETFDLGYQADYVIKDDVVLSTRWIKESNTKESKLIDRETKKEYIFEEYFILDDNHQILKDKFLLKNYSDNHNFYSILSIENMEANAIDCNIPDTYEFIGSDENYIAFMNRNLEKAEFYIISLDKENK